MSTLPLHVCALCPRAQGRSCCEVDDRHGLATLTGGDIARIAAATGRPPRAFVDAEIFDPESAHAYRQLRPANAHAIAGGVRRHLRVNGGACVFHRSHQGCTLAPEVRPLLCRLYPVELDAFGNPALVPSGSCHAEATLEGLPEILAAMGLSLEHARALHGQLLRELRDDARSLGE